MVEWDHIESVFQEALTLEGEEQSDFLDRVCSDNKAMRSELDSLLALYGEAAKYFDSLAEDVLPSVVQELKVSQEAELESGEQVGPYRVLEMLGQGGMGQVYKARDVRLNRFVALKFLSPHLSASEEAKGRFMREARAASSLDHRHICTIYEVGETDDHRLYMAMAHYEGETLKDRIRRGPLPIGEALDITRQIAAGLEAAHARGIVHRDIKPANILITKKGRAKILDFGLAKVADVTTTQAGTLLGTAAYMSPEQTRGDAMDHRTDLWSLGVVLYEMVTGKRPFHADEYEGTLYAIRNRPAPPIETHRADAPASIEHVVQRCLQKAPAQRYASATELSADVQRIVEGEAVRRPLRSVLHPSRLRRVGYGAAVAAAAVLFMVLAWWMNPAANEAAMPDGLHLAVLPFNLIESTDTEVRAYGDGLMEILTNQLTQAERFEESLSVVPSSEVRSDQVTSARQAFDRYQVNLAVTGDIMPTDDALRVTLNLVDTQTLRQVRSGTVSAKAEERDDLQRRVMLKLFEMLDVELQPQALQALGAGGTRVPGAHEFYVRGEGYLQRYDDPKRFDLAIQVFNRALDIDPNFALAHAGLGEAYWSKYRSTREGPLVDLAIDHSEQALALDDQLAQAHVTLGTIYNGTGRAEDAIGALQEALAINPQDGAAHLELAKSYKTLSRDDEAEDAYKAAIMLRPTSWTGYNDLGVFYLQRGRYGEAAEQFEQVVALTPDNLNGYGNLGAAYLYAGNYDDARTVLEQAVDIGDDGGVYANLGIIYFYHDQRYADAAAIYEKALRLDDSQYYMWGNWAAALHWAGEPERAQDLFREAITRAEAQREVDPSDPYLHSDLANYYAKTGQPQDARASARRALDLGADDPNVLVAVGDAYERLGQREEAIRWLGEALAKGYSRESLERLPGLQSLFEDPRYATIVSQVASQ